MRRGERITPTPVTRAEIAWITQQASERGLLDDVYVSGITKPRISYTQTGGQAFLDQSEIGWDDEENRMPSDLWAALCKEIEGFGVGAGSAGGVASELARLFVPIGPQSGYPVAMSEKKAGKGSWQSACRASVFGGRQELFWHRVALSPGDHVRCIDLSAAYMRLLATPLPIGSPFEIDLSRYASIGDLVSEKRDALIAGWWEVEDRSPHPQPLPYRDADGNTAYPCGRWRGVYWASEAYARGVRLVRPFRAWSFNLRPWLRPLAESLLEMRERSCFPPFWKMVGNRVAGNLAAEGPKKTIVRASEGLMAGDYPVLGDLWIRLTAPQPRSYARIHAYSLITSRCRVMLRRGMIGLESGILAVHTDGIYCASSCLRGTSWRLPDAPKMPIPTSTLPAVWRAKERFDGVWMAWRGLGAGTWHLLDHEETVAERRTGLVKQMPWANVMGGSVALKLGEGMGRIKNDGGWTETPKVEEF